MPTDKNGFQIRNLHPKEHVFNKNKGTIIIFLMSIY